MMDSLACPECGNRHGPAIIGYEVSGVYDGVLYWECLKCGLAWPRNFGIARLNERSKSEADQHNATRREQ